MEYFTTRERVFVVPFENNSKQNEICNRFLTFLQQSNVGSLVSPLPKSIDSSGGRPSYNGSNIFATVLFCCAHRCYSLRDMEEMIQNDIRCQYLSNWSTPTYHTLANYLNDVFFPNADKIFAIITSKVADELKQDIFETQYIDGSKFEANANKYKFRWKPTKRKQKLLAKTLNFLQSTLDLNISSVTDIDIPKYYDIYKNKVIDAGLSLDNIQTGKGKRNPIEIRNFLAFKKLYDKLTEYNKDIEICGSNRNSYYLTDHDATGMCLKEDYYSGVGSNLHAAYNVQISVSNGLIVSYYVSQDRADFKTFTPFLSKIWKYYGKYPKNICADSGYGSKENYKFLKENNIKNFVKYTNWDGEIQGLRPPILEYDEFGKLKCLNGIEAQKDPCSSAHPKKSGGVFYIVNCKKGCPFRQYCRRNLKKKTGATRKIEFSEEYHKYTREAKTNLLSIMGIEIRVNRSIQVEGGFGNIKQNMRYERFRRRRIKKVAAEFALQGLGVNIRKLLRYYETGELPQFWKAPENITPEVSHKYRKNVVGKQKKKKLSVNQKAKKIAKRDKKKAK